MLQMSLFPRLCFELHQYDPMILSADRGHFKYSIPRDEKTEQELRAFLRQRLAPTECFARDHLGTRLVVDMEVHGKEIIVTGREYLDCARL